MRQGCSGKKMPNRTYITAEEKMMPGHKPMKDRLTLALCANASGDCTIKPLLVYHSENPRAFKSHKILKEKLQVMWRSNPKTWVTRKFFVEWLWPEAVAERIYEELEPGVSVEEEIVSLGKSMGLEVEERDVNELIEEYTQELTTEEIQELQSQQHTEVMQEIGFEESEEEVISTSEIKEILVMWESVSQFVEKTPRKVATGRASDLLMTLA
ncbi:tigger transposable element-derived protein 1 [Caerostris darwini]|uniref:Tigger transposable element-derived protein 1 n=1 Tax=Caerostris darwini TaxID=1538125 RepID=A0AAV4MIE1_9ARAC|nr:tigger transposable element-derived protein 1 [Caerostris darwini]